MDENRARRVADALRERGIDAHLENAGIDIYGVRVVLPDRREAVWGNEGTASLEAEVLQDGDLVGFVPEIPGSEDFDDAQVVDAIARADYDQPAGRERPQAPPAERAAGATRAGCSAASSAASATTRSPEAGNHT